MDQVCNRCAGQDSSDPLARMEQCRHLSLKGSPLMQAYSSQIRSPHSHSNARITDLLSGKCTVPTNLILAPQTEHSRSDSLSISPIFSALNISITPVHLCYRIYTRCLLARLADKVRIYSANEGSAHAYKGALAVRLLCARAYMSTAQAFRVNPHRTYKA